MTRIEEFVPTSKPTTFRSSQVVTERPGVANGG